MCFEAKSATFWSLDATGETLDYSEFRVNMHRTLQTIFYISISRFTLELLLRFPMS
jgi:hypothetical protein